MRVLASCDSKYFLEHYKAFYFSAKSLGYTPIIEVINPTKEVYKIAATLDNIHFSNVDSPTKTFYAVNRFLIATKYLSHHGILITDIDCYFKQQMPGIQEDIGLFLREYESFPGMKVAAGIVWVNNSSKGIEFIKKVAQSIQNRPLEWYVDQYAIYETYSNMKETLNTFVFDQKYMDWEFTESSYMWTGKGDRKNSNKKYKQGKKLIEEEYND